MKYTIILATIIVNTFSNMTLGNESSAVESLLAADRAAAEAAASGDMTRILSIWADDAVMFYPGTKMVVGKQAIRQIVTANRKAPGFSIKWSPIGAAIGDAGDLGYTYGSFEVTVQSERGVHRRQTGDYVCIWRRQNRDWKCVFEMARPGSPRPQGASSAPE